MHQHEETVIPLQEVNSLCEEIISLLNKANEKGKLASGISSELKKVGQVLYDQLLTNNIKEKLKNAKAENLLLLINEGLVHIPWELLFDGNQFLCIRFNMGRNVKTHQTLRESGPRAVGLPAKMLILADPLGDLKAAHQEAGIIEKELDRKRNIINVAKKVTNIDIQYLKRNLRDYDIVHFAGHADYDYKEPSNSGWKLIDGQLTASDIVNMGTTSPLPSIVFSNACQSAQTKEWLVEKDFEENIFGLANAFLLAGVRHYIGTFWKIPDNISLNFAKEFYYQVTLGESIGAALKKARFKIITDFGEDTIVWASYVLYGDPSVALLLRAEQKVVLPRFAKSTVRKIAVSIAVLGIVIGSTYAIPKILNQRTFGKTWKMFLNGQNEDVIDICKEVLKKDPNYLAAYKRLGNTYDRIGKRDEALRTYFEYASRSEKKKDKNNLANAYINIGWIYHAQGKFDEAFEYYQKGLKLAEEIGNKLYRAKAYRQLALWYRYKGNYEEALKLLYRSTEINRDNISDYNHRYNLACDYSHMAWVFADKDDWDSAVEFYTKSKDIFEQLDSQKGVAINFSNMGEVYFYNKEFGKAEENYLKSLAIDLELGDKWSTSVDYALLAQLYAATQQNQKAVDYFNKSIAIKEKIDDKLGLAENYYEVGLMLKELNNREKAIEQFTLSSNLYHSMELPDYADPEEELEKLGVELQPEQKIIK
ncbi:tetratricopeptide repeat protein [Candidatus Omnitrophota bacterium]